MKKKAMPADFTKQILFDVDEDVHALLSALANANQISIDECAKGIILSWITETEKQINRDMARRNGPQVEEIKKAPLVTLK
jgi:hypothetical protein